ncbi:MAG: hypothetical protein NTW16_17725 [Bacteroidetes bacterium]|nr:hypothetical protein [Bacteroidota bacterium]
MAKLKRSQDFELNFSAFIGKGRVRDAVFTYFNFLGPIAIVHESKPEEKPVEGFDEYLDIIKRAQDYYNVFIGVKKKLKGILRPSTPFDHVGELFIDYTNNLKQVFENTDKLKNLLLSNVDNKFEKINSDISNIDKGFQKADKIYTEIQFNISLPDTTNKDSSNSSSANSFYVFFTAGIKIMPEPGRFSGLRSSTTLYIISAPVFHIGILTDPMQDEKVSFFSDIEKKFAGNKAVLDQLSHNNVSSLIEVHYGKPYSTTVLKTAVDGFDAIEAFKKSTQELYAGLAEIDFLLLK